VAQPQRDLRPERAGNRHGEQQALRFQSHWAPLQLRWRARLQRRQQHNVRLRTRGRRRLAGVRKRNFASSHGRAHVSRIAGTPTAHASRDTIAIPPPAQPCIMPQAILTSTTDPKAQPRQTASQRIGAKRLWDAADVSAAISSVRACGAAGDEAAERVEDATAIARSTASFPINSRRQRSSAPRDHKSSRHDYGTLRMFPPRSQVYACAEPLATKRPKGSRTLLRSRDRQLASRSTRADNVPARRDYCSAS
jgi:hypothetical protein